MASMFHSVPEYSCNGSVEYKGKREVTYIFYSEHDFNPQLYDIYLFCNLYYTTKMKRQVLFKSDHCTSFVRKRQNIFYAQLSHDRPEWELRPVVYEKLEVFFFRKGKGIFNVHTVVDAQGEQTKGLIFPFGFHSSKEPMLSLQGGPFSWLNDSKI